MRQGLAIGAVNVFVVVVLRINSFIATLATLSILGAMIQWISDGQQIAEGIPNSFKQFGREKFLTIPLPVYYMLAIALVLWYVLDFRQFGRYLYATGSNEDAARLAGVSTRKVSAIALMTSAMIATIVGVIFTMRIGAASIDAGAPYLLPAFAAAFLGATQFKEGNVNVPGTVVAVYVLATGGEGRAADGRTLLVRGPVPWPRLDHRGRTGRAIWPAACDVSSSDEAVLTVTNLSKSFGGTQALRNVDFEVRAGEIHALVGQNGSGKSTLIKILAGYHSPDDGATAFGGRRASSARKRARCDSARPEVRPSRPRVGSGIGGARQPGLGPRVYEASRRHDQVVGRGCDGAQSARGAGLRHQPEDASGQVDGQ